MSISEFGEDRTWREDRTWGKASPLSLVEPDLVPDLLGEGPVRYVLVESYLDDDSWGVAGAFWLSRDGRRGGFLAQPEALWSGSEFVRNYQSAADRDWTPAAVYDYWRSRGAVGMGRRVMPEQHYADSLVELRHVLDATDAYR